MRNLKLLIHSFLSLIPKRFTKWMIIDISFAISVREPKKKFSTYKKKIKSIISQTLNRIRNNNKKTWSFLILLKDSLLLKPTLKKPSIFIFHHLVSRRIMPTLLLLWKPFLLWAHQHIFFNWKIKPYPIELSSGWNLADFRFLMKKSLR